MLLSGAFAKPITGYWEGYIMHQQKKWHIAIEFKRIAANETIVYVDFIEIGGYRRLFSFTQNNNNIHLERQQPDGRPRLVFDGTMATDSLTGRFAGIGITGAVFTLRRALNSVFDTEEIIFYNDTIQLKGTILLPAGKGPFPAVIITHGSGPDTRSLYYGIAVSFVKKGVAALIYDKRGLGESGGGDYTLAGISDLAKDALAGLQALKTKKQINAKQIGMFGHSQGGWIAPMAAVLSADVAFVITSAASAVTAAEQSVYHRANVMRREGFDETSVKKSSAIRRRLNAATKLCFTDTLKAREAIKKCGEELNPVKNEPWLDASALPEIPYPGCPSPSVLELLFKEPVDIWRKVKVPVYAVWGQKDFVVPVEKHSMITEALKQAGNKKAVTKIIPDTDHSILIIRSDNTWDFPREPPGYFSDMAIWVRKLYD